MSSLRLVRICALFLAASLVGHAQAPAPAAPPQQLSPAAAYTEALTPLSVTRANIANWSDTEMAALRVSIARAGAACSARKPASYTGADLVDLARLCSLGQQWSAAAVAATGYIDAPDASNPLRAIAYSERINAFLHLHDEAGALKDTQILLASAPYTADLGETVDAVLDYLRFAYTDDALTLAAARQTHLLQALRTPASFTPLPPDAPPALAIHTLYADGLLLPALQQLAGRADAAERSAAQLEAALPVPLPSDEAILTARARRQYNLLGKPLVGVKPLVSLDGLPRQSLPAIPAVHTITALLLFPDWCAQCVRMGLRFPETVFSVRGHSAYLYGLLALTTVPQVPPKDVPNIAYDPRFAATYLAGTPTLTVAPSTLDTFAATAFPLMILTDGNGVVRAIEPLTADDLERGGALDAAVARLGDTFPVRLPGHTAASRPTSAPAH